MLSPTQSCRPTQAHDARAIGAELTGDDVAVACGITVKASAPVLALCRALIAAGHSPGIPLEAYRGDVLCLRVRSIGEGARMEINGKGNGFRTISAVGTALPVRRNGAAATQGYAGGQAATQRDRPPDARCARRRQLSARRRRGARVAKGGEQ